jgi:hypothetical protein
MNSKDISEKTTTRTVEQLIDEAKEEIKQEMDSRQEICKQVGKFLIAQTEICFSKCMNCNIKKLSMKEKSCFENCYFSMLKTNELIVTKFYDLSQENNLTAIATNTITKDDIYQLFNKTF